jgi:hypothetical protein
MIGLIVACLTLASVAPSHGGVALDRIVGQQTEARVGQVAPPPRRRIEQRLEAAPSLASGASFAYEIIS